MEVCVSQLKIYLLATAAYLPSGKDKAAREKDSEGPLYVSMRAIKLKQPLRGEALRATHSISVI